MPNDSVPFYHYTSDKGLEGILRDSRIDISDPRRGDAREGPGAYGTKYPPSTRTSTIARNNWDGGWREAIDHGKMRNYVRCEVPRNEVEEHPGHGGREDGILLHRSGIDLSKYRTRFGRVGQDAVPEAIRYDPEALRHKVLGTPKVGHIGSYTATAPQTPWTNWSGHSCGEDSDSPQHYVQQSEPNTGYNSAGNYYESYEDGSYRYENANGSTYEYHGNGEATYTSPQGFVTEYDYTETSQHGDVAESPLGGEDYADDGDDSGDCDYDDYDYEDDSGGDW